jgi:hypothetical protein
MAKRRVVARASARHSLQLEEEDPLSEMEEAVRQARISIPVREISDYEVDSVPICEPDDFGPSPR